MRFGRESDLRNLFQMIQTNVSVNEIKTDELLAQARERSKFKVKPTLPSLEEIQARCVEVASTFDDAINQAEGYEKHLIDEERKETLHRMNAIWQIAKWSEENE